MNQGKTDRHLRAEGYRKLWIVSKFQYCKFVYTIPMQPIHSRHRRLLNIISYDYNILVFNFLIYIEIVEYIIS